MEVTNSKENGVLCRENTFDPTFSPLLPGEGLFARNYQLMCAALITLFI